MRRREGWAGIGLVLLLAACSRPPADAPVATSMPEPAGAKTVSASTAKAAVSVPPVPARWQPPEVERAGRSPARLRQQAARALARGELYKEAESAIPLYLAVLQGDPEDRLARRGLQRALARVLARGEAALAQAAVARDGDPEALETAEQSLRVMLRLASEQAGTRALQAGVARARRLEALVLQGQAALAAAGDVGENEAAAAFAAALALAPDDPRARQGRAAVESAWIARAEQAAEEEDFERAGQWLEQAGRLRPPAATVADARVRVAAIRHARVEALVEAARLDLLAPSGLRAAQQRLEHLERIASRDDLAPARLRARIERVRRYGLFRPGQVFTDALDDGSRGPQMVVLPHGGFVMGAGDVDPQAGAAERPAHYVRFERGFAMSLTEVTVAAFGRFVAATGFRLRADRRGHSVVYDLRSGQFVRRSGVDWRAGYDGRPAAAGDPVMHVSVRDAEAYARWLSERTGRHYRLPTEAEFEYALRAGQAGRYAWGDALTPPADSGNYTGARDRSPSGRHWDNAFPDYGDGYWGPAPAGRFRANAWGLHDMAGNLSEWVADCWHASYRRAPADGGAWYNPGCRRRVVRGGGWSTSPAQTRAAWRMAQDSDVTSARIGFRLVRGI